MRKLFFLCLFFHFFNNSIAQTGKITGKVINAGSGQVLAGATILLIEKSKKDIADQNGQFTFSRLDAGSYSIKCSYVGYNEKIVDEIVVKDGDNTAITISLDENKSTQAEVTITSKVSLRRETVASLLTFQKNNASVSDGISAESIRKTPDRSTSDVLKRVSGASIQDDRFVVVRGLNDRYNAAFINGAPLPSTESDRKAFSFDIFPSAILDNLVIYKTATPDKSGDFAGGIIDITTKSTTPKNFTSISFAVSYNTLATGNARYFSEAKGGKDWLGLDDGTRGLPAGLPSPNALRESDNDAKAEYAKKFGKYKWGVLSGNTSPDFNFQASKGFNIEKDGKEFISSLFSINYKKGYTFNEGNRDVFSLDGQTQIVAVTDSVYNAEVVWAVLGNFSVKLNSRNSFSWKNNMSVNTDNRLIKRFAAPDIQGDPTTGLRDVVRWYTSNQIFTSQLAGDHLVGNKKTKINWLASYSKVKRDLPSLARSSYGVEYPVPSSVGYANFNNNPSQLVGSGTMFFSNLDENLKSIKADITQPYTFMKNSQNFAKLGGGYQFRKRAFTSRLIGYAPYSNGSVEFDYSLQALPENQIHSPENLGAVLKNGKGGFLINDANSPNSDYNASSAITHLYIMNDQRFFKKFRLIYGVRMERFEQKLNLPTDTVVTDFLPSVNLVYALTSKMNMRLSFAKTVNRAEFRELAPFLFYDYLQQYSVNGDIKLQRGQINNYDFRYEFFPGRAQLFSVSAFYKTFINPIEVVFEPGISQQAGYRNAPSAKLYGLEAEFRTLLSTIFGIKREDAFLSKFTLSANAAYIKSEVKIPFYPGALDGGSRLDTIRPLQGQSPYLINSSLNFNDEKTGLSSTISVNRVGDRLSIPGTKDEILDIFEKARTVVDFQLTKSFLKSALEVKFTARDILAQDIIFYFDADKSKSYSKQKDQNFSNYKAPKVFTLSVTYKF